MTAYTQQAIDRVVEDVNGMIDKVEQKKHFFSVSAWLNYSPIAIYARVQYRLCDGKALRVVTIANIEIEEQYQRQGIFKELLTNLERLAKIRNFDAIVAESLNNYDLRDYLLRVGFKPINQHELMIAMTLYREVNREQADEMQLRVRNQAEHQVRP